MVCRVRFHDSSAHVEFISAKPVGGTAFARSRARVPMTHRNADLASRQFPCKVSGLTKLKSCQAPDFDLGHSPGLFPEGRRCRALRPDRGAGAVLSDHPAAVIQGRGSASAWVEIRRSGTYLAIPSAAVCERNALALEEVPPAPRKPGDMPERFLKSIR